MYVCIYVCVYVCIYVRMCIYVWMNIFLPICLSICLSIAFLHNSSSRFDSPHIPSHFNIPPLSLAILLLSSTLSHSLSLIFLASHSNPLLNYLTLNLPFTLLKRLSFSHSSTLSLPLHLFVPLFLSLILSLFLSPMHPYPHPHFLSVDDTCQRGDKCNPFFALSFWLFWVEITFVVSP